jgi:hypothetical protein
MQSRDEVKRVETGKTEGYGDIIHMLPSINPSSPKQDRQYRYNWKKRSVQVTIVAAEKP